MENKIHQLFENSVRKLVDELKQEIGILREELGIKKKPKCGFTIKKIKDDYELVIDGERPVRIVGLPLYVDGKPRAASTVYKSRSTFIDVEVNAYCYNFITGDSYYGWDYEILKDMKKREAKVDYGSRGFAIRTDEGRLLIDIEHGSIFSVKDWKLTINGTPASIKDISKYEDKFIEVEGNSDDKVCDFILDKQDLASKEELEKRTESAKKRIHVRFRDIKAKEVLTSIEAPKKSMEVPKKPIEAPKKSMEVPKKPIEAPRKPVEVPKKPIEAPKKSMEIPKKPIEAPRKPVEVPKKPIEAPRKPMEVPKKPIEAPRKPVEVPKKPIEAPKHKTRNFEVTVKGEKLILETGDLGSYDLKGWDLSVHGILVDREEIIDCKDDLKELEIDVDSRKCDFLVIVEKGFDEEEEISITTRFRGFDIKEENNKYILIVDNKGTFDLDNYKQVLKDGHSTSPKNIFLGRKRFIDVQWYDTDVCNFRTTCPEFYEGGGMLARKDLHIYT
jgi:hypothetical protein